MPWRCTALAVSAVALMAAAPHAFGADTPPPAGASGAQTITLYVPPIAGVSVQPDGSVVTTANTPVHVTRERIDGVETVTLIPEPR